LEQEVEEEAREAEEGADSALSSELWPLSASGEEEKLRGGTQRSRQELRVHLLETVYNIKLSRVVPGLRPPGSCPNKLPD
jgi:hypothetical protein